MFHDVPPAILARMAQLEEMDARWEAAKAASQRNMNRAVS